MPFYVCTNTMNAHREAGGYTLTMSSLAIILRALGHLKTLCDLSHVTKVLMLPSSFGAIQLGETFTSCISQQ